jgi:hypothetical protein
MTYVYKFNIFREVTGISSFKARIKRILRRYYLNGVAEYEKVSYVHEHNLS